jgi:hypothetical protein
VCTNALQALFIGTAGLAPNVRELHFYRRDDLSDAVMQLAGQLAALSLLNRQQMGRRGSAWGETFASAFQAGQPNCSKGKYGGRQG